MEILFATINYVSIYTWVHRVNKNVDRQRAASNHTRTTNKQTDTTQAHANIYCCRFSYFCWIIKVGFFYQYSDRFCDGFVQFLSHFFVHLFSLAFCVGLIYCRKRTNEHISLLCTHFNARRDKYLRNNRILPIRGPIFLCINKKKPQTVHCVFVPLIFNRILGDGRWHECHHSLAPLEEMVNVAQTEWHTNSNRPITKNASSQVN